MATFSSAFLGAVMAALDSRFQVSVLRVSPERSCLLRLFAFAVFVPRANPRGNRQLRKVAGQPVATETSF